MQKKQIRLLVKVLICFILVVISLNIMQIQSRSNTIYIGTKNLTEQQILANLYQEVIEANTDYNVKIVNGLDTTSFVQSALETGDIDMYIDYTSTAYLEVFKHKYEGQDKNEIINTLKHDYHAIDLELNSLLGFENSNAIICSDFCANIDKISELSGKEFTFAAPAYFFQRSDGYNLLKDKYDFSNVKIVKADPVIIYQGILNGQIDVGLGFTTDAKLARDDLKVLDDTDNIYPSYDAMLITRRDFKTKFPEVNQVINKMSGTISTKEIRNLNNRVENKNAKMSDIIEEFIKRKGY